MRPLHADPRYARAVHAVAELLGRLKVELMFVGGVARAAWLGTELGSGAVDVLVIMQPQQKNQVAMMASHRGFRVEREEIEQSEELDLVPLNFVDPAGDVRVHVLLASNALYARMFATARTTTLDDREIRVPSAEDFALLAGVGGDEEAWETVSARPDFDRSLYNEKMLSIGLGEMVIE
jgi:hypothetical protein